MSQPAYGNSYKRNVSRSFANQPDYGQGAPSSYSNPLPSPTSRNPFQSYGGAYQQRTASQPPSLQWGGTQTQLGGGQQQLAQQASGPPQFQAYSPPGYQGPYRMGPGGNFTPGTQQGPPSYHMPTRQWHPDNPQWQFGEQIAWRPGPLPPQIQGGMNTWNPGLGNGPAASSTWQENQNQHLNQMRSLGHGVTDDGRVQFGLPTNPLQDPWIVENLRQQQANQLQQQMFTAMGRPLLGNTIMANPYNSYRGATDWGMTGGDPVAGIQSSTPGFHFGHPGQEEVPLPSAQPFPFAPWMIPRQGG